MNLIFTTKSSSKRTLVTVFKILTSQTDRALWLTNAYICYPRSYYPTFCFLSPEILAIISPLTSIKRFARLYGLRFSKEIVYKCETWLIHHFVGKFKLVYCDCQSKKKVINLYFGLVANWVVFRRHRFLLIKWTMCC